MSINTIPLSVAEYVRLLLKRKYSLLNPELENLSMGYRGYVFGTSLRNRKIVIKVSPYQEESHYEKETFHSRIYGSRQSEYVSVESLLNRYNIQTPETLFYDTPEILGVGPCIVRVQRRLEGIPSTFHKDYLLKELNEYDLKKYFFSLGEIDATIHQITRPYDGWVGMEKPSSISYEEAYFGAFTELINFLRENHGLDVINFDKIVDYVSHTRKYWEPSKTFVLSPNGLFQGLLSQDQGKWKLNGVIDLEDHHFTEERLCLVGFDIHQEEFSTELFTEFWSGYESIQKISPNYYETRNLYVLFFYLSWLKTYVQTTDVLDSEVIQWYKDEILKIISSN